ncbi:charged multivesicular body protein 5-like isoform X1 [Gossypium australe]|uniref:Charged multivesicular body protein 5-like isoform X1 n=1 Tax=Gossypium australe TaxID=47621 RepID=A0A5B6WKE1_9ROSI|nr:charged multivesicular body protein 5-like isoform X1 [Gossypium australe]
MKRVFGVKKDKEPPPSIQDASDRLRLYEGQRDMLYNQTFNLDQVAFASEGLKDAQQTMSALKSANKELKGMMKTVNIQDIDNLQDEMMDMMDVSNEIQETLGRSYNVPDYIDEEELMGELDALEADMGSEADGIPSYLQPDKEEPDLDTEFNLPAAPTGNTTAAQVNLLPCSFSIGLQCAYKLGYLCCCPIFLHSVCYTYTYILFKPVITFPTLGFNLAAV